MENTFQSTSTTDPIGVIVVHQFWGNHYDSGQMTARKTPGVNVNLLHSDKVRDRFCGMPVFNGTPCRVEKVKSVH
jgi:hypothetical protein